MFDLNTEVTWTSQSAGVSKTKQGRIVAVVPAKTPVSLGLRPLLGTHRPMNIVNYMQRPEVSYLVAVPSEGKGQPRLYWPRVAHLARA